MRSMTARSVVAVVQQRRTSTRELRRVGGVFLRRDSRAFFFSGALVARRAAARAALRARQCDDAVDDGALHVGMRRRRAAAAARLRAARPLEKKRFSRENVPAMRERTRIGADKLCDAKLEASDLTCCAWRGVGRRYIGEKYKISLVGLSRAQLKHSLQRGVEAKTLVQVKHSYKVAKKAAAAPKAKAAKAAVSVFFEREIVMLVDVFWICCCCLLLFFLFVFRTDDKEGGTLQCVKRIANLRACMCVHC